jgi:cytochrome c551/c552
MRNILILVLGFLSLAFSEEKGKTLFQQRCAACHKLEQRLIGPPLAGIQQRREKAWFAKFVLNSQALIQSGDKAAIEVYEAYNKQIMPPHPDFTQADIDALWDYLNVAMSADAASAQAQPVSAEAASAKVVYPGEARPLAKEVAASYRQIFWLLVVMTTLITLLLAVVIQAVSIRRRSEPS